MSGRRQDYGPTGCLKPIRRSSSLLLILAVLALRRSRRNHH